MKNKKIPMIQSILGCVVISLLTSCSSFNTKNKLEPVPEIHPGILQGYLPVKTLPNSLA